MPANELCWIKFPFRFPWVNTACGAVCKDPHRQDINLLKSVLPFASDEYQLWSNVTLERHHFQWFILSNC